MAKYMFGSSTSEINYTREYISTNTLSSTETTEGFVTAAEVEKRFSRATRIQMPKYSLDKKVAEVEERLLGRYKDRVMNRFDAPATAHVQSSVKVLNTMSIGEFEKLDNGDSLKVRTKAHKVGNIYVPCNFFVENLPTHSAFYIAVNIMDCPSAFLSQWKLGPGDKIALYCKWPKMTHFNIAPDTRKEFINKVIRKKNFSFLRIAVEAPKSAKERS